MLQQRRLSQDSHSPNPRAAVLFEGGRWWLFGLFGWRGRGIYSRKITNVLEVRLRIQGTHSLRTYRALREYMCVFLAGGSGTGLVYFGWHWPAWEYSLLLMFTRCIKIHLRDLTLGATY